jgi:phosphate-selective porin OprO and OprP
VDAIAGIDPKFSGTYVQASYFLTGEHRPYNSKYRLFSRVRPKENYTGRDGGGRGAWQVALRYSELDLDDALAGVMGGQQSSTTLGINWHLNSYSRVMLNQTFSELETVGDSESISLRFQVDF